MRKRFNTKRLLNKNEKGIVPLVFLLMVLIFAAILIGVFVVESQHKKLSSTQDSTSAVSPNTQQSSKKSLQQSSTESWPVYTDQFDDYSIKYPQGWYAQPAVSQGSVFATSNFDRTKIAGSGEGPLTDSQYIIEIYVENNPLHLSLPQIVGERDKEDAEAYKMYITNQQTIITTSGTSLITRESINQTMHTGAYEAYAVNGDKYFVVTGKNNNAFKSTFNLVADSFKLTL